MSGEQWACEACLPRGGLGVLPQNFFKKVSALRLLVGFGNQALITVVIAPVLVFGTTAVLLCLRQLPKGGDGTT